jgi:hypothetical protein
LSAARRVHQVLAYESTTTLHFDPMVFVDLEGRVRAKLDLVAEHRSQIADGDLFDLSSVAAQARYRGTQARVGHAEGFQSHRFVWALAPAPTAGVDFAAPFGARALLANNRGPARGRADEAGAAALKRRDDPRAGSADAS